MGIYYSFNSDISKPHKLLKITVMKNILFTLTLLLLLFACSDDHKKNDLTRNNLNGNVKSIFRVYFEAVEKEGGIIKGNRDNVINIFEYDDNGYVIEYRIVNSNGGLSRKIIYEHDDNGNSIEQNGYNWAGELLETWTSEFDTKGNEMKSSVFNSDGKLENKYTAEYDDKGNRIKLNLYNSDDELLQKWTYDEYDDKGNLIKEKQYTTDKELENEVRYEYEFDDKENWIQQIIFINDKATTIVEREIKYYDKSGDDKPMKYLYLSKSSKEYNYIYYVDEVMYYKEKKFNGEISYYNEKKGGYLNYTDSYHDGLKHGTSNWYLSNGKVYTSTNYVKGKKKGSEKKYNPNNGEKLLYIIEYDNDTIKEYQTYNNDVMVQREVKLGNDALHIEQYDSSGELVSKGRTNNRKRSFRLSFVDEIKDGIWEFYEKGKLKTKARYKNGKLIREIDIAMLDKYEEKENVSGDFKEYWANTTSSVKSIVNYKNGERDGVWKYFHSNNTLSQKEMYHEDKEHGLWETYDYNGRLLKKIGFKHGTLSGPYEEYYYNGNPKIIGRFDEGEEEGVWKEYKSDGDLTWKELYNKGKMDGIWEEYDENGKLYWRFELENGSIKEGGINEMKGDDF